VFCDLDIEQCLQASIRCAHHIVTKSTFSYMIGFLDSKVPEKSQVLYESFDHLLTNIVNRELEYDYNKNIGGFLSSSFMKSKMSTCGQLEPNLLQS